MEDYYEDLAEAGRSDRYERNDTMSTAAVLRSGQREVEDLTIHTPSDTDWFSITLPGTGTTRNVIEIDYSRGLGDLNLGLHDAQGNLIAQGSRSEDGKAVSLNGVAAGRYYIQVSGNGGVNEYDLDMRLPGASSSTPLPSPLPSYPSWDDDRYEARRTDRYESNDTLSDAVMIPSGVTELDDLTINTAMDQDWFGFVLSTTGTVRNGVELDFDARQGDLDLSLADARGNILAGGTGTFDGERISLNGYAPGQYYIRVNSSTGSINEYELDFALPVGTGSGTLVPGNPLPSTPVLTPDPFDRDSPSDIVDDAVYIPSNIGHVDNMSLDDHDDMDWFAVNLADTGTAGDSITVKGPAAADLQAVFCSSALNQPMLASGTTSVSGEQGTVTINLEGYAPGMYFFGVYSSSHIPCTYDLDLRLPDVNYNDTSRNGSDLLRNTRYNVEHNVEIARSLYFQEDIYLNNKLAAMARDNIFSTKDELRAAIADAGMTPWDHFRICGSFEIDKDGELGIDAGSNFDTSAYYGQKMAALLAANDMNNYTMESLVATFRQCGLDVISHYAMFGEDEGLRVIGVAEDGGGIVA